jgi:hypothetical protein
MPNPASSSSMRQQLLAARRFLALLDRSLVRLTAGLDGSGSPTTAQQRPTRRKMSPRARAALKLQGRYMGYMRQLKPRQKAEVRAVKEKKGVEAAIRRAQQLAQR